LRDGPDAFADSFLFNDTEKRLFDAVFDKDELGAIDVTSSPHMTLLRHRI
jgi:hypothetical protein